MSRKSILASSILVSILVLWGCHTWVFQPVKKQIVGTWIISPVSDNVQTEWTFTDDGKLYIVKNYPVGNPDTVIACDSTLYAGWHIENKVTKHYLYTDNWEGFCKVGDTNPRWLIIKLNGENLYISSENEKRIRGTWQFGFTKK
jgi:hypothetical protein